MRGRPSPARLGASAGALAGRAARDGLVAAVARQGGGEGLGSTSQAQADRASVESCGGIEIQSIATCT